IAVVVVGLDLCVGDKTRVLGEFILSIKDINNFPDIPFAEAILVAVLYEALGSVDHENAPTASGVLFVEDDDAGRDSCAVEQVCRKPNDAFDIAAFDDVAADLALRTATEQNAV